MLNYQRVIPFSWGGAEQGIVLLIDSPLFYCKNPAVRRELRKYGYVFAFPNGGAKELLRVFFRVSQPHDTSLPSRLQGQQPLSPALFRAGTWCLLMCSTFDWNVMDAKDI